MGISTRCRRSRIAPIAIAVAVLGWGCATAWAQKGGSPGPTYVDVARSIRKQREAADAAEKVVAEGTSAAERILGLLGDPSALVRDRVVGRISADWSEEDLAVLGGGLESKSPLVREGIAEIYGKRRYAAGVTPLIRVVGQKGSEDAVVISLWALGEIGDSRAVKSVEKRASKERRSTRIKAEALHTLLRLDPDRARKLLDAALEDKLLPVRIEALLLLSDVDPAAAVQTASTWIGEPPRDKSRTWGFRVLFACLDVVRGVKDRESLQQPLKLAIDAMVARLEGATGREREDLGATLSDICGQSDLPPEFHVWEGWWKGQRETWSPGPRGPGNGPAAKPKTEVVRYHGIPVDSLRVTFLLDTSGGMSRNAEGDFDGPGATRLDSCKEELARVLGKLAPASYVSLISFASFFEACSPVPVPLAKGRKRLLQFNADQQVPKKPGHSRGNLYDSLVYACSRPHVDTIYLLTEGAPTEGKYLDYDRFLEHFQRWNRPYRTRIHTLLMGRTGARNREFLEKLAKESGGTFREIGG